MIKIGLGILTFGVSFINTPLPAWVSGVLVFLRLYLIGTGLLYLIYHVVRKEKSV